MSSKEQSRPLPRFALIKQFLRDKVESGDWPPGTRIPPEQALCDTFSVSRMTARRAVKELADEGFFDRTPGLGSFVKDQPVISPSLDLIDVVAEARTAGTHSHKLLALDSVPADAETASLMQLHPGETIYRCTVLHLSGQMPIQWQRTSVNPTLAPALLKQKFTKVTPDAYLNWIAPVTSSQFQLQAVIPSASQRLALELSEQRAPLGLQLSRRDWQRDQVVSFSTLLHPADQYHLGTDFQA
ncbi:MAG: UTRA domain-containing protein [Porticoccaceae bacterium]